MTVYGIENPSPFLVKLFFILELGSPLHSSFVCFPSLDIISLGQPLSWLKNIENPFLHIKPKCTLSLVSAPQYYGCSFCESGGTNISQYWDASRFVFEFSLPFVKTRRLYIHVECVTWKILEIYGLNT